MAESNSSNESPRFFFQIPENIGERINLNGNIPYNVGQTVSGLMPRIVSMGPNQHRTPASRSGHTTTSGLQNVTPISEPSFVVNIGSDNPFINTLPQDASGQHGHLHRLHIHDENQNEDEDGQNNNDQSDRRLDIKMLLMNSGIFILILFVRLMSDHVLGNFVLAPILDYSRQNTGRKISSIPTTWFLVFIGLAGTFFYANMTLQRAVHEASLRDSNTGRNILSFLWVTLFLSANICCVFYVFRDQKLWNLLIFSLPAVWSADIWLFMWVVIVTDFIVKFLTMIIKSLLSMLPVSHKKRFYRLLLPTVPWFHFLFDGQSWLFGGVLTILYSLFKSYGVRPSSTDMKTSDEAMCPICQDNYKDPVMLNCKHIFCESCVSVWFDREKTCPMCRAQIHTESPLWKDGSTSIYIQWY
ncbi:hypothetical protein KUTeg_009503 [Tegillarca granosa]|uniref:RING-type domain-containing protein n=1 Tax=Tegillarca granosa TaxID=220873 RepID=A0ABQ9F776_TEGGR|nr:hypothetical protein KUTeg_009503 [Tegillarca granosa]